MQLKELTNDMASVVVEHEFNVPAKLLWDLIGDFGNTGKWSGSPPEVCVQEGEGIGSIRTLTMPDGGKIVDRLDTLERFSYSYSILSSPLPFDSYSATFSVFSIDGERSKFVWAGRFEPSGISEEEGVEFFNQVYRRGINMMQKTLAQLTP